MTLFHRLVAEFLGTAFLLIAIVGSGIKAELLAALFRLRYARQEDRRKR